MKAKTMWYLTADTRIHANWSKPLPPGWTEEGGFITLAEGFNEDSVTIYLDRDQALRLQGVVNDLVAGMDTAGPVFEGHDVSLRGCPTTPLVASNSSDRPRVRPPATVIRLSHAR